MHDVYNSGINILSKNTTSCETCCQGKRKRKQIWVPLVWAMSHCCGHLATVYEKSSAGSGCDMKCIPISLYLDCLDKHLTATMIAPEQIRGLITHSGDS